MTCLGVAPCEGLGARQPGYQWVTAAGLDLAGALFAKEWADNGSVRALVLGRRLHGAVLGLRLIVAGSSDRDAGMPGATRP